MNQKHFYFLFFCIVFPFTLGNLGTGGEILLLDFAIPYVFIVSWLNGNLFTSPLPKIYKIAIFILLLSIIISFLRYPKVAFSGSSELFGYVSLKNSYYPIFLGIASYVLAYYFTTFLDGKEFKLLKVIYILSFTFGYTRLITYILGIEMPLLGSVFRYAETEYLSNATFRAGGIGDMGGLGLLTLIASKIQIKWKVFDYVMAFAFIFLIVMSGGRTTALGVLFAVSIYFIFIKKTDFLRLIAIILFSVGLLFIIPNSFFSLQIERILKIQGDLSVLDYGRYRVFDILYSSFIVNPLLGKGIRPLPINESNDMVNDFVYQQVIAGGHGAYVSVIGIFGIMGAFFLIVFLFYSLYLGCLLIKKQVRKNVIIVFVLLIFFSKVVTYSAGNNGFNDISLYFYSGILSHLYFNNKDKF